MNEGNQLYILTACMLAGIVVGLLYEIFRCFAFL